MAVRPSLCLTRGLTTLVTRRLYARERVSQADQAATNDLLLPRRRARPDRRRPRQGRWLQAVSSAACVCYPREASRPFQAVPAGYVLSLQQTDPPGPVRTAPGTTKARTSTGRSTRRVTRTRTTERVRKRSSSRARLPPGCQQITTCGRVADAPRSHSLVHRKYI